MHAPIVTLEQSNALYSYLPYGKAYHIAGHLTHGVTCVSAVRVCVKSKKGEYSRTKNKSVEVTLCTL